MKCILDSPPDQQDSQQDSLLASVLHKTQVAVHRVFCPNYDSVLASWHVTKRIQNANVARHYFLVRGLLEIHYLVADQGDWLFDLNIAELRRIDQGFSVQALAVQLLRGLVALHDGGVVHGCVSERAVLCVRRGRTCNFSLSCYGFVNMYVLADSVEFPADLRDYMPEQRGHDAQPSVSDDLWQFGVLLSRLSTRLPDDAHVCQSDDLNNNSARNTELLHLLCQRLQERSFEFSADALRCALNMWPELADFCGNDDFCGRQTPLFAGEQALKPFFAARAEFVVSLDISDSPIKQIDLRGFSRLLSFDGERSGLESLAFESNAPVRVVCVAACTRLRCLCVSGCACLRVLDARQTQLNTLDTTGLSTLQYLNLADTRIEQISLPDMPALECALLFQTRLNTLDVSASTRLKVLGISGIQGLERISGSLPAGLLYFKAFNTRIPDMEFNTATRVQQLHVDQNPSLQRLEISRLRDLRILYAYRTAIATLETYDVQHLRICVIDNTKITHIDTRSFRSVIIFTLSNTAIAYICTRPMTQLAELSVHNTRIASLDLRGCAQLQRLKIHGTPIRFLSLESQSLENISASSGGKIRAGDARISWM